MATKKANPTQTAQANEGLRALLVPFDPHETIHYEGRLFSVNEASHNAQKQFRLYAIDGQRLRDVTEWVRILLYGVASDKPLPGNLGVWSPLEQYGNLIASKLYGADKRIEIERLH